MSDLSSNVVDRPPAAAFDAIFTNLPPLDSAEYLELLEKATVRELPAQVLVRAFRQLIKAGEVAAADATLVRLLADKRFDYLGLVRGRAGKIYAPGNYGNGPDDLLQETIHEVVRTLPTDRGAFAEVAWVKFLEQRFEDARRRLYGREYDDGQPRRVEPYIDTETGEEGDPAEQVAGGLPPGVFGAGDEDMAWLGEFIRKTANEIVDPVVRYIAIDQWSDDPSPISAGTSEGGKPPLDKQLGVRRFRISRDLKKAKARLAAALMSQKDKDIRYEWLRKFVG